MAVVDPWIAATIALLILVAFLLALLVPRRPRVVKAPVTDQKLDALTSRLDAIEKRQSKNDHDTANIRMAMQNMPTQKSVSELMLQVGTLTGSVNTLGGKLENLQDTLGTNGHTLNRIQNFLFSAAADHIVNKNRAD